jgi:hypothetical protein
MTMTGSNGILSVPSEHLPGVVVLAVLTPTLWVLLAGCRALAAAGVAPAVAVVRRCDGLTFTAKAVVFASLVGALVHGAIVPTHWSDEHTTALLFIVDTVGFVFAAGWTFVSGRHWRLVAVAMLGGTAAAYVLYIVTGWETVDLVGVLTTTIELAAALLVVSPAAGPVAAESRRAGEGWIAVAAVPVALLSLLGAAAVAGTAQAAPTRPTTPPSTGSHPRPSASSSPQAPAMAGMPSGRGQSSSVGTATTALSLPTTSPAGPVVWPDQMGSMAAGMEMATPDCVAQPTATQQQAAVLLVDRTVAAVAPYRSLAAARAAGYVPVTRSGQKMVHYINPTLYRQGRLLDPDAVPVLVYVNTDHGAVLSAAMYLMSRSATGAPPQPGGCLTQWHIHTDLCFRGASVVGNDTAGSCAAGSVNQVTQPMMHVWLTPVSGGPLAPDPPAASEVEAANAVAPLDPPNATA